MELLVTNLTTPVVLAFALGLVARAVRSDLAIPDQIQSYLSIFLLLAIGLKGGVALRGESPGDLALLIAVTIAAGAATTFSAFWLARTWLRDPRHEVAHRRLEQAGWRTGSAQHHFERHPARSSMRSIRLHSKNRSQSAVSDPMRLSVPFEAIIRPLNQKS